MPWRIVWQQEALDNLTERWMETRQRQLVNQAVDVIEAALREDPAGNGDGFYGDLIIEAPPLAAAYRLDEVDRVIYITMIFRSGPRA